MAKSFRTHLHNTVCAMQGLLTTPERRLCPQRPDLQPAFLAQVLGAHSSHQELAAQIRVAWKALRREKALSRLISRLSRTREHSLLRAVERWKVALVVQRMRSSLEPENRPGKTVSVSTTHSFDSSFTTPVTHQRTQSLDNGTSCWERLFAESKDKDEIRAFQTRIRAARETAGCTFQPSVLLRRSEKAGNVHERLYRHSRAHSASKRRDELAQLSKEKLQCTFQPAVLRPRTPDARRWERLHEVKDMQLHCKRLQTQRLQELDKLQRETPSFQPVFCTQRRLK